MCPQSLRVLRECGLPWLLDLLNSPREEEVTATEYALQAIVRSLAGIPDPREAAAKKKREEALDLKRRRPMLEPRRELCFGVSRVIANPREVIDPR